MTSVLYKVTITPFAVSDPNNAGFIDHKKVEHYGITNSLTYQQCMDKRRGNMRWGDIMESLSLDANASFEAITATGASATTDATNFYFEVAYRTPDQPAIWVDGVLVTGIDAVKHMVARALIVSNSDQCEVFDPTLTEELSEGLHPGGKIAPHIAVGSRFINLEVGKLADTIDLAKAKISVTI